MADLSPAAVAARLATLRALYEPMNADEARELMTPPPEPEEPFETAVARRLAELRALCELTRHLRHALHER